MLDVSFQARHTADAPIFRLDIATDLTSEDWLQLANALDILYTQVRAMIRLKLAKRHGKDYHVDGGTCGDHTIQLPDSLTWAG